MDVVLNEIDTFPEIKKFSLVNLFTNEERIVTHKQLVDAFGETELNKIKSGRNNAWLLTEIL